MSSQVENASLALVKDFEQLVRDPLVTGDRIKPGPELPEDPELALYRNLCSWARHPSCKNHFLPWLEQVVKAAEREAHNAIEKPLTTAYNLGVEAMARALQDKFNFWME